MAGFSFSQTDQSLNNTPQEITFSPGGIVFPNAPKWSQTANGGTDWVLLGGMALLAVVTVVWLKGR